MSNDNIAGIVARTIQADQRSALRSSRAAVRLDSPLADEPSPGLNHPALVAGKDGAHGVTRPTCEGRIRSQLLHQPVLQRVARQFHIGGHSQLLGDAAAISADGFLAQ